MVVENIKNNIYNDDHEYNSSNENSYNQNNSQK